MTGKSFFLWVNYYITHPEIGTTTKIRSEILTLRKMGYTVTYTAYLDDGVAIYDNNDNIISKKKYLSNNKIYVICFRRRFLISITRRYLRDHAFDFCLLRINIINHSYYSMLREMKQQRAFVMMETLSYYPNMKKGKNTKISYYLIAQSLKNHKDDLKDVVDLILTEGAIQDFYGIPCIEFGMGVDVDNYNKHHYIGNKNELNMLMVGCHSVYHGTDRIIKSLKNYYDSHDNNCRQVFLHLVGDIQASDKRMIEHSGHGDKIILYGRQTGIPLDDIYNKCNIALGPLAQYRIMKKDTGLKTKEYFARGIPYVYSGEEVKIEKDYPYILNVDDSDSHIDIDTIFRFVDNIGDPIEAAESMRVKAHEAFSWVKIFDRVFLKVAEIKKSSHT